MGISYYFAIEFKHKVIDETMPTILVIWMVKL